MHVAASREARETDGDAEDLAEPDHAASVRALAWLERHASAELHLERDRNGGRGPNSAQIANRLIVGRGRVRGPAVAVSEVRPVQHVVELREQGDPTALGQPDLLGDPGIEVDERLAARVVRAEWLAVRATQIQQASAVPAGRAVLCIGARRCGGGWGGGLGGG